MLSQAQEKRILSTHTKKGRERTGLVLLEGKKMIAEAGDHVEFTFDETDTPNFASLVTTATPQLRAGLAKLPEWTIKDILKQPTILLLDHVQDPGNIGTILRSALAFHASVVFVACADVGNPKVIRSSVGAIFHTPWIEMKREEALAWLATKPRPIYRLELTKQAKPIRELPREPALFIAGSEGQGITLPLTAPSVFIPHDKRLESLNVAIASSLLLYERGHKP